jgi:hypothetical protein
MLRPRLKIVFYSGTPRSETKSRLSLSRRGTKSEMRLRCALTRSSTRPGSFLLTLDAEPRLRICTVSTLESALRSRRWHEEGMPSPDRQVRCGCAPSLQAPEGLLCGIPGAGLGPGLAWQGRAAPRREEIPHDRALQSGGIMQRRHRTPSNRDQREQGRVARLPRYYWAIFVPYRSSKVSITRSAEFPI